MTAAKEIKFHYADMHGNLKVVLDIPIRNRYVVGFKTKEDMGQIITCLGTDDYEETSYEEYILKAFFSGKVTSVDHPISLLNQISLLYNLCQLSVAQKILLQHKVSSP